MITALIVDDEDDVRALIRLVIDAADHGLSVIGEAADGSEALQSWHAERPTVVILDQKMPGLSGMEVAEQMLAEVPDQKIILFSAYFTDETVRAAQRLGVGRCLHKTQIAQLPEELWAVVA